MKCYEEFEHGTGACLILESSEGKWAFPWASLVAMRWLKPDEHEITLRFQQHEIAILGSGMSPLFESLSQGRVKRVSIGKEGELSVDGISVSSTEEV